MDLLHKGWFTEFSPDDLERMKNEESGNVKQMKSDGVVMGGAWPGQAFSLKVKEVLFHQRSDYQDVLVFKSESYGNVLVLDGIIQATERDEFSYQEMLAHLPMFAHPNPKKVLIIGGGDGGILREVLKHPEVEQVTMCEIDRVVIDVSKKFLPGMSCCFSSPKLNLYCGDGFEFLKNNKNQFDVIITDSSDPIGPAESLLGNLTMNYCETRSMKMACFLHKDIDVTVPSRKLTDDSVVNMNLQYYNSELHSAAFVLPQFIKKELDKK